MEQEKQENNGSLIKMQESYSASVESMLTKVKVLIGKLKDKIEENKVLKDSLSDLNTKVNDTKLQLNKLNSIIVLKDKEISDLKNNLLQLNNNKASSQDKEALKSRIKELISRIDVHLEQYNSSERIFED